MLLVEDDPGDVFLVRRAARRGRSGRSRLTVAESLAEVVDGGLLARLRLRAARPQPARHQRASTGCARSCAPTAPPRSACSPASTTSTSGSSAVAAGAQDYLVKGKVDGAGADPRRSATPWSAGGPRRACCGCARSSWPRPSRRVWSAGCCRRRCWPAARCGPASFYRAGPRPLGDRRRLLRRRARPDRHRARDRRRRLRPRPRRGGARRAAAGVLAGAGAGRGGRAAAAAQAAAGAGQRAARPRRCSPRSCTVAIRAGRTAGEALVRLAGHPPPMSLLGRRRGRSRRRSGCRWASRPTPTWEPATVPLDPGWALLLYTDGLIEGRGPGAGRALWEEGLLECWRRSATPTWSELPARLVERAQELNGGPLVDDVAILLLSVDAAAVRRRPGRPPPGGAVVSARPDRHRSRRSAAPAPRMRRVDREAPGAGRWRGSSPSAHGGRADRPGRDRRPAGSRCGGWSTRARRAAQVGSPGC